MPEILTNKYYDIDDFLKNYEELKKQNTTSRKLSKYEKTRVLGQRAKQLEHGHSSFIKTTDIIDSSLIAEEELKLKLIPLIIRRPLPHGGSEYWRVSDLEILY